MPAIRNIVSDLRFEISAGNRKCDVNDKHIISKGEKHFAYEKSPGHRLNICMKCAPPIIKKSQEHLASLANDLP